MPMSLLVVVAIARIHHTVIVFCWSQTNTYKRKKAKERERASERTAFHTLDCLDKIKQRREATVDVVIPDIRVLDA